ncbi:HAD family phosphatase [Sphingomonas koreensis]|nr:HAD family phosphatase [Sphingomonas koreensis]
MTLVVCDVDGTLVDSNKQLSDGNKAGIARLTAAGIGFTVISARPRSGMMWIADALSLDAPMGAFNGGIVFRRDGTVDAHHVIDAGVARGMFDLVGDAAVDRWVFADDRWYASSDQGTHVEHERRASNQDPIVTDDFAALLDHADKITFVSDDAALLAGLHERASARFGDAATVVQSQTYYLDVTAQLGNKGDGISALAEAMGVSLAETIAIGDQANDIAMFERAGRAIAVGNATDAVKAKADAVTTSNDQDGVAHAIDTMILKEHA